MHRLTFVVLLGCLPVAGQDPFDGKPQDREIFARPTNMPIELDGVLDEPAWAEAEPATDFIQREPFQGEPATEKTEVRILYDDKAIYFGISAFESEPDKVIINSLREDFTIRENDGVSVYLDTFNDDRNAFGFYINPAGAKRDVQSVDQGRNENPAWETVWDVKTKITEEGWFAEIRIPFKSLRFSESRVQTWGINFQRRIRRRSEQSFWAPIPRSFASFNVSFAGTLRGVEDVHPGQNFKVKPFLTSQFRKFSGDDFDTLVDLGLDLKYSLTSGLTLDATLNTDFSQVEVDEQRINLTRFSLFFPEKRDFFLENSGIFLFAQTDRSGPSTRDFIPFFSRRIGLSSGGQPVPVLAGARFTGRVGEYSLGLFNMQTRESDPEPAHNFTVLRLKRNILAQSELGTLFINRQSDQSGDYNRTFGVDASFRFWQNLRITSFLATTRTPGFETGDMAGRTWVEWKTNLWEARTDYLDIGENFNAEVGFIPRRDIRKSTSFLGLRPRPRSISWIREFFPNAQLQYITDQEGRLVTRITDLKFQISLADGGSFQVGRTLRFEREDEQFSIGGLEIASGDYNFDRWFTEFRSDTSDRVSGSVRYETGDFWDGTSKGVRLSLSFKPNYKFTASARFQWDDLKLQQGNFTTRLINTRLEYAFNTQIFLSAFIQYNSERRQVSSNLRFNLIHRPLSDIFIVYNEERDSFQAGETDKSLTFKYTHMFDMF
ncbi:MAG: DUF5916 domain-containing protein [Acidobacteria bacterium]|nr:DUF5916 domain-containing protein [Acidobacteriota bacterium]